MVMREDGNRSCGPGCPLSDGVATKLTGPVRWRLRLNPAHLYASGQTREGGSTPPLREIVNLLNRFNLICPVQSRLQKFCCSRLTQISCISPAVSSPRRGVSRSSRTRGGMRWTRQRRAWKGIAGWASACERSPSRRRPAQARTAKSCGPGTRCWCQVGGGDVGPTGLRPALIRQRRWQKEFVTGESAKETVKTIACGNAG